MVVFSAPEGKMPLKIPGGRLFGPLFSIKNVPKPNKTGASSYQKNSNRLRGW